MTKVSEVKWSGKIALFQPCPVLIFNGRLYYFLHYSQTSAAACVHFITNWIREAATRPSVRYLHVNTLSPRQKQLLFFNQFVQYLQQIFQGCRKINI